MGNQSNWTGKHILHYIVAGCIVAALNIVSCAPVQNKIAEIQSRQQLEQYREDLANGSFEAVILHAGQVVEKDETVPPADVALYALGEVYAHQTYDGRDYVLSQSYFERFIENFPDSQLISEAKIYISLFESIRAREQLLVAEKQKSLQKEATPIAVHHKIVENKNFEEAVRKNMAILNKVGNKKPADEALYNLGLIHVHIDNPAKDYKKSQNYFLQLINKFPESELTEEAQIWLGFFETLEKIQQIDVDIDQQKKQLTN